MSDGFRLNKQCEGVSLRDQFAMAAMTGMLSMEDNSWIWNNYDYELFAVRVFKIADAMLKERDK